MKDFLKDHYVTSDPSLRYNVLQIFNVRMLSAQDSVVCKVKGAFPTATAPARKG